MAKKSTKTYNNHILVPKHEKLSEKQKQDLLKEFNCAESHLPKARLTDPAIAELAPKPGDVIRISRESRTEGISIFYRVVINE